MEWAGRYAMQMAMHGGGGEYSSIYARTKMRGRWASNWVGGCSIKSMHALYYLFDFPAIVSSVF